MIKPSSSGFRAIATDHSGAGMRIAVRWLLIATLCVGAGACAGSSISPSPEPPARTETTDGRFHLTFEMPKTTWRASETIEGEATLTLSGNDTVAISGSSALFGFAFDSADGTRHIVPIWPADCYPRTLDHGNPMTQTLAGKSGDGWTTAELSDPLLHLTHGDWTITAVSQFSDGSGCATVPHNLTASVPIHVAPDGKTRPPLDTLPPLATLAPIVLGFENSTDLAVTLSMNGTPIEVLNAKVSDKEIRLASLPPLPWVIEVRTTSGRVVLSLTVGPTEASVQAVDGTSWSGKVAEIDLSCGRLRIWTGSHEPSGPVPGSGSPGDCVP